MQYVLLFLCVLFLHATAHTQICTGSLGDPIINITFGAGPNPGSALPGATTNYQFQSNDCPGDGFYTVRNSTTNCFGSTWHNLTADHTGDANGYFMLVNSSVQPSAFYIDTVNLLCVNTTYEFAAWVLNLSKPNGCSNNPIKPNLTFRIERIDGSIIQSYNSGNVDPTTTPSWKQFGFMFQTPNNVSRVVLKIINNATGGCGNDLTLDDITFRPCGPTLTAATINGSTTVQLCAGKDTALTIVANASGYNNPDYRWQQSINGSSWSDIPGAISTTYTKLFTATTSGNIFNYRFTAAESLNASESQCRVTSPVVTVTINALPIVTITNNSPVCAGGTLQLTASGGVNYQWNGPNNYTGATNNVILNNAQLSQSGRYKVQVSNAASCTANDSADVVIVAKPILVVSNATQSICRGDRVQLLAAGGQTYQWSPATGLSNALIANPVAAPASTTKYTVVAGNSNNCFDSAFVQINVLAVPQANAGSDKAVIGGQAVTLNGSVNNSDSFYWSPPLQINNVNTLTPLVNPTRDAVYVLHALSKAGCSTDEDSVFVKVYQQLIIPNAFSPNSDGINDTWNIPALSSYKSHNLQLFDRYGRVLFKSNAFTRWDGKYKEKDLPVGIYYYILSLPAGIPGIAGSVLILR